jgi:hypothetical protein
MVIVVQLPVASCQLPIDRNPVSHSCLILTPADPCAVTPPPAEVLAVLRDFGLVHPDAVDARAGRLAAGGKLLWHVTFLGCSPALALHGESDAPPCHLHIRQAGERVELLVGGNVVTPRCPDCRAPVAAWRTYLQDWRTDPEAAWRCPECKHASTPARLDWRQHGGAGRLFVEIWGVFPGEAVPGDALMAGLEVLGAGSWRHFYYQSEETDAG